MRNDMPATSLPLPFGLLVYVRTNNFLHLLTNYFLKISSKQRGGFSNVDGSIVPLDSLKKKKIYFVTDHIKINNGKIKMKKIEKDTI